MADIKVAILEKDGTEFDIPVEYKLVALDVPFDNSGTSLVSTNVQNAILEVQTSPIVNIDNFSYKKINNDKHIIIPTEQQMIVVGDIIIDGILEINGDLILIIL